MLLLCLIVFHRAMLSEWFWWDRLWLPRTVTWADLQDSEGRVYARVSHLYITLPVAVLLLGLRAFYERYTHKPNVIE